MKELIRWSIIVTISVALFGIGTVVYAQDDDFVFGIKVEQRALDLLMLMSQRMAEVQGLPGLQQVISMKAKIVFGDLIQPFQFMDSIPDDFLEDLPDMIFQTEIEIFRSAPDLVRVNLTSNLGDLQFAVSSAGSLAVLPEDGIFAEMNIPQMLPDKLILEDDGGLLTLINLMGGIPYGLLLHQADGGGIGDQDIEFGPVAPGDTRAVIRYWGKDKTPAGIVHVINILTAQAAPYNQSIKILVLEDTLDLYLISIEDERGTEVFIFFDEINTSPVFSEADFAIDTSSFTEVSEMEFLQKLMLNIASSPVVEQPVAVDLAASSHKVARTGSLTMITNGFDLQDREDDLLLEVEYRSPGGTWTPLGNLVYAGLVPLGHWNAVFMPEENAETGLYSFRARYTDSSGNDSGWLEVLDIIEVTPAPPRVARTQPVRREMEVHVSTQISVTFNKPMDKKSVEDNFSVTTWTKHVQGSFSWDENTVIFSPSDELRYETTYLVMVRGDARDADGIGLDGDYDAQSNGVPYDDFFWTFRTSSAPPMLALVWQERVIKQGDRFNLRIMLRNVTEIQKFGFKLIFNPDALEVEKVDEASFASWRPRPKHIEAVDLCDDIVVDNLGGSVVIACDSTRAGGVSGSGEIATISFHAIGAGAASLAFEDVSIVDSSGRNIEIEIRISDIEIHEFHPMDVNHDGVVDILDFVAIENEDSQAAPQITQMGLGQNYPNPFNPETWIPYQLAQPSYVNIRIYRTTGELTRSLDLGTKEPGFYADKTKAAYWDGTDDTGQKVSSGVYFYTIQADGFTATRKMLLLQ